MKEFGIFLVKHYEIIISGVLAIFSTVLFLVKKKPYARNYKDYINQVIRMIPTFIRAAEAVYQDGESKKHFVITQAMKVLRTLITLDDDTAEIAEGTFDAIVEDVLNTPAKKVK